MRELRRQWSDLGYSGASDSDGGQIQASPALRGSAPPSPLLSRTGSAAAQRPGARRSESCVVEKQRGRRGLTVGDPAVVPPAECPGGRTTGRDIALTRF
jgi:hypothetical protein